MSKELHTLNKLHFLIDDSRCCDPILPEAEKYIYELEKELERKEKLETENTELKARNEKLEKVWDIVDKKQVAWGLIVRCESVEEYNKCTVEFSLTKTEFNLLKEMLRNEKI